MMVGLDDDFDDTINNTSLVVQRDITNLVKCFRKLKLCAVIDKWKDSVFTESELNDKIVLQQITLQVENILTQSPPGERSQEELQIIVGWIQKAFPQLFVIKSHHEVKQLHHQPAATLTLANRLMPRKENRHITKSRGAIMSPDDLLHLSNRIKIVKYSRHHTLFQQGDSAKNMYGILRGETEVFVQDHGANSRDANSYKIHDNKNNRESSEIRKHKRRFGKLVARLACGDILGELGLSTELGMRSATVQVSCNNTVMIEITKSTYYDCFHELRDNLKERFRHISFLKSIIYFDDWREQRLQHLFYPMQEQTLNRSCVLTKQLQRPHGLYIIVSGTVLSHVMVDGQKIDLGISGKI